MTKRKNFIHLERLAKSEIKSGVVFGIDVGIASCGWAVVDTHQNKIIAMGSRCFEKSEDNDRKLLNATRRGKRGSRRVTARRQSRMKRVRKLIEEYGLSTDSSADPWVARIKGLEYKLKEDEAVSALIHIAKHRGFKSNRKGDSNDAEDGKVQKAVADWRKYMGERTYPQALIDRDIDRKRNRPNNYQLTPPREMIEEEARSIIGKQRDEHAEWATKEFEERYINAAFYQRDLRGSEAMVGKCIHEKEQPRTSRFAYSYEKYRLLESLIHKCKISDGRNEYLLTTEQLEVAVNGFGNRPGLTFRQLRKLLKDNKVGLPDDHRFVNAKTLGEEKNQVTTVKSGASTGSYTLRKALPKDEWESLIENPHILDDIAEIITFNESLKEIQEKLSGLPLDPETVVSLMDAVGGGDFKSFKGTGHISSKAARNLIPEMLKSKNYYDACISVGYDPTATREIKLGEVGSAVAKRSLKEAIKQVVFLIHEYGRPERINVELMREVGKSAKIRGEITAHNNRRTKEKKNNKIQFEEEIGQSIDSDDDLERFELLKAQGYQCPYCGKPLRSSMIVSNQPQVEIEHIYPLSRSADNSYQNKVLSCIACNQDKRDRTPWEWIGGNNEVWVQFEARVNLMYPTSPTKKRGENKKREKKKRLLNKTFAEREQGFINRNQVDTSRAARALTTKLIELYQNENGRYIFAVPGPITGMVRKSWLKQHWAKDRDDDRHHAMDALIVAMIDSKILPKVTREHQKHEELGRTKFNLKVPPPWDTFAEDAITAYNAGWLVCRTENRRVRGALHEETIRRMRVDDDGNEIYYERKSIDDLTATHIKLIPDPVIQAEVQRWFDAGKPKEDRPKSANGDEIRRLRLPTKIKTARQVNADSMGGEKTNRKGGFVGNSNMVRVDVFRVPLNTQDCQNELVVKGYYIVPVYGIDIIHKDSKTPLRAVGGKDKSGLIMDPNHFVMSLYKDSYVKVTYANGNVKEGYYRQTDIGSSSGSIELSLHHRRHRKEKLRGIGVRKLRSIRKFHVDRFGQKHEIPLGSEKWPGHRDKSEPHKKQPES